MLEYNVVAKRLDAHGSTARCKNSEIALDTDVNGRSDAFNPAELLLAAVAACMIKGIERVAPMIHFSSAVSRSSYAGFARIVRHSCLRFPMS